MMTSERVLEITTGFLSGNLTGENDDLDTIDVEASARKHADLCETAIRKAYPGVDVDVSWQHGVGCLPDPLRTTIITDACYYRSSDAGEYGGIARYVDYYRSSDAGEYGGIARHVDEICQEVWEAYEWLVETVAD